jgi:hypothetical protein
MAMADGAPASDRTPRTVRRSPDAFAWGYPASVAACLIVSTFFEPLLLVIVIVVAIFLLLAVVALFRRRFKRASALVLGPLIFISLYVFQIGWMLDVPRDLIRFYYHKKEYAAAIDALPPAERTSRVVFFNWGSSGFVGSGTSYFWLVYDESGEVALPDGDRTEAWKDKVYPEHSEFTDKECLTKAHRLIGHYYSMMTSCTY